MSQNCSGCVLVANLVSHFAPEMLSSVLVGIYKNWWRFEIGRSLGADEAMQAEDHRLTATALAFHDALLPEETASMQL